MAAYKDKLRQQNFNVPRRGFYRMEKRERKRTPADVGKKKRRSTPSTRRTAQLRTVSPAAAASEKLRHEEEDESRDENSGNIAADAAGRAAEDTMPGGRRQYKNHPEYRQRKEYQDTRGRAGDKLSFFDEDGETPGAQHPQQGEEKKAEKGAWSGPEETGTGSNPLSRNHQKKGIRRRYAEAVRKEQAAIGTAAKEGTAKAGGIIGRISSAFQEAFTDVGEVIAGHLPAILMAGVLVLTFAAVTGGVSSCSMMLGGGGGSAVATSFTAEDSDILGTEEDYKEMEDELRKDISSTEEDHPGFDEYRYVLDEIGHNPYELASILTILFEDYRRDDPEVQEMLQTLFNAQYELSFEEEKEERVREVTKTATREKTDPETGQTTTEKYTYTDTEVYEYRILVVTLQNNRLRGVIDGLKLSEDEMKRFEIILSLKGNRPYLFQDDIYANIDADAEGTPQNPYLDYRIPGEALTDAQFARMLQEAEKYLGRSYVWGGSSPAQGFDCSGYVCWVINHSGVGNIGRTTAEGLRQWTDTIPASERKPGDIVYFEGTYDTPGASHVGIYVGGGMMIHCGNPCKYSNIDSGYFARHMLGYGRIPQQP